MRCAKPCRRGGGFTLIEVVVSLSLMAIIGALVLAALRTGMAATEKGALRLTDLQSRQAALEIMEAQIRGAVPLLYSTRDGLKRDTHIAFDGDRSRLRFVSRDSWFDGPGAVPRWVELTWTNPGTEAMAVHVQEFRILPPDNAADSKAIGEATLLSGSECQFEYLRRARGSAPVTWVESWRMDEEHEFPAAVRLTTRLKRGSSTLLIPLQAAATNWRGLWLQ